MRSPRSFTVVVRRADGSLARREEEWKSLSARHRFLRVPFLRGGVVLIETLVNGIQALVFSANQAAEDELAENEPPGETEEDAPPVVDATAPENSKVEKGEEALGFWALFVSIAAAVGFGLVLFVVLPHYLTAYGTKILGHALGVESILFHLIDGVIKVFFLVGYIMLISLLPDIRRVFMYHGAEHKSIYAYENGDPLTVEAAEKYPTLHPRCGTSFLLFVLVLALLIFAAVFPLLPEIALPPVLRHLVYVAIKLLLMFPVAGVAYEIIKFSGKRAENPLIKPLIWPGLLLQRLTTREPTTDQIEVALAALKGALEIEGEVASERAAS